MYELEIGMFFLSAYLAWRFLSKWYRLVAGVWPSERTMAAKISMGILPFLSLLIILYTLRVLASFDVVDDFFYILFYILFGYAWLSCGMGLLSRCLDLSWMDDALHHNNRAALFAVGGSVLAITLIYSGANVGDGPGWWCILFAGGLGMLAWYLLAYLLHRVTNVMEQVTIGRDTACGIRLGFYLLASGIILARASAGDWTSAAMTVVEFLAGWPVLILTALAIVVERYSIGKVRMAGGAVSGSVGAALWIGVLYFVFAVACVLFVIPPLNDNPMYHSMLWVHC